MAKDVVATMSVAEVALVQTVQGDYAVWIDGKETGIRVQLEATANNPDTGIDCLLLEIDAGRLELRA